MTDIRAVFIGDQMVSDFALDAGALQAEPGLETAIIISLFTDRRANADDELPAGAEDRRGWWGDVVPPMVDGRPVDGARIGSRLWLLSREKQMQVVVTRAREYCREALAWMIEDGVCERIDIEAEIVKTGTLGVGITIHRPQASAVSFKFDYAWQGQENRSAQ